MMHTINESYAEFLIVVIRYASEMSRVLEQNYEIFTIHLSTF